MQEAYNYIGIHYDILGREIGISDKKYGLTTKPSEREKSLTATKSPIQYMVVKLFKFDNLTSAQTVEDLVHLSLNHRNTNGEWFEDKNDDLIYHVEAIHDKLRKLGINIQEIPLEKNSNLTQDEKELLKKLDRKQLNKEFFNTLKLEMDTKTDLFKSISSTTDPWIRKSYKRQGFILVVSGSYSRIELYIDGGDKEENEKLFSCLLNKKDEIEKELGYGLLWEILEEGKASRISASVDGNIYDKAKWKGMIDFMVDKMPRFSKIMSNYIDLCEKTDFQ